MKVKNLALVAMLLTTCMAAPVGVGAESMPMEGEMQSHSMGGADGMNANAETGGKMGTMGPGMSSTSDLVPLRQTAESLGYKVTWNDQERSVMLEAPMGSGSMSDSKMMGDGKKVDDKKMMDNSMMMGGGTVKIVIDSKTFWHGGQSGMLDIAPLIVNEMTYVSRKFFETYVTMGMGMKTMEEKTMEEKSMMK
jgi:hypothetical protein